MPDGNRGQSAASQDRRHLLKALAAGGMLGLAGCSGSGDGENTGENGSSGGGDGGSTQAAFWHDKPDWDDGFKTSFSEIEGEAPAEVSVTSYGSTDSYQGALRPVFGTTDGPTLFTWWTGQRLRDIASDGYALDITEQWEAHIENGEYDESLMQQFSADGSAYAVPYYLSYWVVWYHKATFDEMGLSEPETWSDFEQICADIAETDKIPIQIPLGESSWPTFVWFEEFLIHEDPEFYNALCRGEAKYTDDTAIWALEKMAEYQRNGYFGPAERMFQLESPTAQQQLANGEYVMHASGDWLSGIFSENDLEFSDMGWFILPNISGDENPRMIIEPGPIVPHAGTENEEMTREFIDLVLSPEFQSTVNQELGFPPTNQEVDPSFLDENKRNLVNTINEEDIQFSLRYWENTSPEVAQPATETLEQLLQYPDRVQQVAEKIENERQRVYE
ncbi:ABC transporter substrate-binding protein [Haloprofundus halobius]|uniref:ABC transporter substrate-binding protein n=1 Tax=Haloprofundus halobius TaxID=2876194 RepID=UPI001CCB6EA1|nr:ABC transporter substrate-binding protein [Haloprofundus halobius]